MHTFSSAWNPRSLLSMTDGLLYFIFLDNAKSFCKVHSEQLK